MYITPWRSEIQRHSDDRELNQATSKPDTVDQPVRTARTLSTIITVHNTVAQRQFLSIFPVIVLTNITSEMIPCRTPWGTDCEDCLSPRGSLGHYARHAGRRRPSTHQGSRHSVTPHHPHMTWHNFNGLHRLSHDMTTKRHRSNTDSYINFFIQFLGMCGKPKFGSDSVFKNQTVQKIDICSTVFRQQLLHTIRHSNKQWINKVTTCLEMSGNLTAVREGSGKKSCWGKVA